MFVLVWFIHKHLHQSCFASRKCSLSPWVDRVNAGLWRSLWCDKNHENNVLKLLILNDSLQMRRKQKTQKTGVATGVFLTGFSCQGFCHLGSLWEGIWPKPGPTLWHHRANLRDGTCEKPVLPCSIVLSCREAGFKSTMWVPTAEQTFCGHFPSRWDFQSRVSWVASWTTQRRK